MAVSATSPSLNNPIREDVPAIQRIESALLKMDPTDIADLEVGAKRFTEVSSGFYQLQQWNGSQWVSVGKLKMDADTVDGYDASITPKANTVAVRGSDGKLQDSITGNAATADSATTLSETLEVGKGGTGATTAAQARVNLGVPPTSHASANTTYGISTDTTYGHAMAGKNAPKADSDSGSVGSDTSHFSRQDHSHPKTKGTSTIVGSVLISDATDGERGADNSVAASEKAVSTLAKKVPELAKSEISKIPVIKNSYDELEQAEDGYYLVKDESSGTVKIEASLPIGYMFTWPFTQPYDGCIIANGAEYSRELYADLWSYLVSHPEWCKTDSEWQTEASQNNGYCSFYSSGNGSTTFRTPKFAPFQQIAIAAANAGLYHQAGLPDSQLGFRASNYSLSSYLPLLGNLTGSIKEVGSSTTPDGFYGNISTQHSNQYVGYHDYAARLSYSSPVFGRSNTVQPESHSWIVCIVAYGKVTNVGEADVAAVMSAIGLVQAEVATKLPDSTPHIVETWHEEGGDGYYRKWSNGWVEQGGVTEQLTGNYADATLYIEMRDTGYHASVSQEAFTQTTYADASVVGYNKISTTVLRVRKRDFAGIKDVCKASWTVSGYAKE